MFMFLAITGAIAWAYLLLGLLVLLACYTFDLDGIQSELDEDHTLIMIVWLAWPQVVIDVYNSIKYRI